MQAPNLSPRRWRQDVQSHPQVHSELEASLGYMQACLKKKFKEKKNKKMKEERKEGEIKDRLNLELDKDTEMGRQALKNEVGHVNQVRGRHTKRQTRRSLPWIWGQSEPAIWMVPGDKGSGPRVLDRWRKL